MTKNTTMLKIAQFAVIAISILAHSWLYAAAPEIGEVTFKAEKNWLLIPIKANADYSKISIYNAANSTPIGAYDVLLTSGNADWFAELDISAHKGSTLVFKYEKNGLGSPKIIQSDSPETRDFTKDRGRPKFHLTAKHGWLGETTGMIFFGGKWHVFFDYNPFAMTKKQSVYWGHASSKDLVNWEYEPNAARPEIFNGKPDYPQSGAVFFDGKNKSGFFGTGGSGAVFVCTRSESGDNIIWSKDLKNFQSFLNNPVIKAPGSACAIFYNEDSGLWTILRSEPRGENEASAKVVAIYVSKDMKTWEKTDEIPGYFPNGAQLRKMHVVGVPDAPKWVMFGSDGLYLVGDFDGKKFSPLGKGARRIFYGNAKDARLWENVPGDKTYASARIDMPGDFMRDLGQKFSQSLGIPWNLNLVKTRSGEYQLRAYVPEEIDDHLAFPSDALGIANISFASNTFTMPDAYGNKYMIMGVLDISAASSVSVWAGTAHFLFDKNNSILSVARLLEPISRDNMQSKYTSDALIFKLFVDTYGVEMFLGAGDAVLFMGDSFLNPNQEIKLGANGRLETIQFVKYPVSKYSNAERGEISRKRVRDMETGKK